MMDCLQAVLSLTPFSTGYLLQLVTILGFAFHGVHLPHTLFVGYKLKYLLFF